MLLDPIRYAGRAKATCIGCSGKKRTAYLYRRNKTQDEASEVVNKNQQLRLQMEEQADEIVHLKNVLSVMAKPRSLDEEFYIQCQRLHMRPADCTVSFQVLASQQANPSQRNLQAQSMPEHPAHHMNEPYPRDARPSVEPKREKLDSGLTDHKSPPGKLRREDSTLGSAMQISIHVSSFDQHL